MPKALNADAEPDSRFASGAGKDSAVTVRLEITELLGRTVDSDVKNSRSASSPIAYRPDIDGLRAICVIAVIGFHMGLPGFGGGYVGVDVFFVISGYLITLLLIAPSDGTLLHRLSSFYVRRARRILPALIVLLIVSSVAAVVLFLPLDLRKYGRSLALAATMLGNVGAWLNGGYYDSVGRFAPLLHLWSIGVEEQFYLVFPLVLLLASRLFGGWRSHAIAALAVVSFALCVWISYLRPSANYYFSPTRAWQLLVGSFIALTATRWVLKSRWNEVLAASSLIVLVAIVCSYSARTRYPGMYALPPTLATAGLLIAGMSHATVVGRVLSLRPVVFTGLISYSLYLWHAPIVAFVEYYNITPLSVTAKCAVFLALYVVATLSWAVVERPFRTRVFLRSDAAFVSVVVGSTLLLTLVGVVFWHTKGLPQRFSPDVQQLTEAVGSLYLPAPDCAIVSLPRIREGQLCNFGSNDPAARKVVLWGDSHAFALLPAYEQLARAHGLRIYFGSSGACRPLLDVKSRYESDFRHEQCTAFNEAMLQAVDRLEPELIVLNAYWGYPDTNLIVEDTDRATEDTAFLVGFEHVLRRAKVPQRAACVILDVPSHEQVVPYALAMASRRGRGDEVVAMSRGAAFEQYAIVDRTVRALEARGLVSVVDPKDVLCSRDTCDLRTQTGRLLYRDAHHLSLDGARFVAPALEGCLRDRAVVSPQ